MGFEVSAAQAVIKRRNFRKLRCFLDLIDENGRTIALEEERGIFLRSLQNSGVIEGRIGALDAR